MILKGFKYSKISLVVFYHFRYAFYVLKQCNTQKKSGSDKFKYKSIKKDSLIWTNLN